MQLKTTGLLKELPRKKLEVNPFQVLEIHNPLCLRPQPWAKLSVYFKDVEMVNFKLFPRQDF